MCKTENTGATWEIGVKVYQKDWISWGDYLGYKPGARKKPFKEARSFAQSLGLGSVAEWRRYCRGEISGLPSKPHNIPSAPNTSYPNDWTNFGDWLGNSAIGTGKREFLSFVEARAFVQSLDLKSANEWRAYCKGDFPNIPKKPDTIPVAPYRTYSDEWINFGDWLGTDNISFWTRKLRTFADARDFARSLNLSKGDEWRAYCKGAFPEKGAKPDDIPASPDTAYKDEGWAGMGDWLGTGVVASSTKNKNWRPFLVARKFVHTLNLQSQEQWFDYCKGRNPSLAVKPDNIPSHPARPYRNLGWSGFGDWLGTGRTATHLRHYKSFAEARAFAHGLKLKSQIEWREFTKSGKLPVDMPASPIKVYKDKGWSGWRDWLGTSGKKSWRAFGEARDFARALHLRSQSEWIEFSKSGKLPSDIPARPEGPYETEGFSGYKDWLGNERWAFQQSREYVRELKLQSNSEWRKFSKSKLRPENIPANPDAYYKGQGWVSWPNWLGTEKS